MLSCLCLAVVGYVHWTQYQKYAPENLALAIQNDFAERQDALPQMMAGHPNYVIPQIKGKPAFAYLDLKNGKLVNWSDPGFINADGPAAKESPVFPASRIVYTGHFICYQAAVHKLIIHQDTIYRHYLIPVFIKYDRDNYYLISRFCAGKNLPNDALIQEYNPNINGQQVIRDGKGAPLFSVVFKGNTYDSFKPTTLELSLLILAICLLNIGIVQWFYASGLMKTYPLGSLIAVWGLLGLEYLLLFLLPLSDIYKNIDAFSPKLMTLNTYVNSMFYVFLLQYLILTALHDDLFDRRINLQQILSSRWMLWLFGILFIAVVSFVSFYLEPLIFYKVIFDSKIPLDLMDIRSLTVTSFIGLLLLLMACYACFIAMDLINRILAHLTSNTLIRFVIVAILAGCSLWLPMKISLTFRFFFLLYVLFAFGLNNRFLLATIYRKAFRSSRLSLKDTVVWLLTLIVGCGCLSFYLVQQREHDFRKDYAVKQKPSEDFELEFVFSDLEDKLIKDRAIVQQLDRAKTRSQLTAVIYKIQSQYIEGEFDKYLVNVYVTNKTFPEGDVKNPVNAGLRQYADSIYRTNMLFNRLIFLFDSPWEDKVMYWAEIPIDIEGRKVGAVIFTFALNTKAQTPSENLLTREKLNPSDQRYIDRYSTAIYHNGHRIEQNGTVVFPLIINKTNPQPEFIFRQGWQHSVLEYHSQTNDRFDVMVDNEQNAILYSITLLSYLTILTFLMEGCILLIISLVRIKSLHFGNLRRVFVFGLKGKIKLSMASTVIITFIVAGFFTTLFVYNYNVRSQTETLQKSMQFALESVTDDYSKAKNDNPELGFDEFAKKHYNRHELTQLAQKLNIDMLLFDTTGKVLNATNMYLINRGIEAPYLDYALLKMLKSGAAQQKIQKERIGKLDFISMYSVITNNNNEIVGVLKIPYYNASIDVTNSISNVIVTIFNTYFIILCISIIILLSITNGISAPLMMLIEQFRHMNPRSNNKISWPYHDEIGLLVDEYNLMTVKVESMTQKLLKSERETAWKEIAQQVAHEIKNPLTPMKLNIQYLQKAIQQNRSDVPQLVNRIAEMLLEQIDNLTLIAGEFSSFAKLPEISAELLDLNSLISSVITLFQEDKNVQFSMISNSKELEIWADKSQLIRIFTNIIKNAIQAIPDDRTPQIRIRVQKSNDHKVTVAVSDNGTGIPERLWDKLFSPYFTTKSSGSGLGLAMTKKMTELMGGRIWFDTRQNIGTTFYVQFSLYMP